VGYAHTMKSGRHIARLTAVLGLVGAIVIIPTASQFVAHVEAVTGLGAGGEFHPLTPARIYDSRPGLAINEPAPGAKLLGSPAPATFDIGLLGLGGVPDTAADVLAVVVNITVTDAAAGGYLEAYGKGAQPVIRTSIINFGAGDTVPNASIVRPGADGDLTIGLFGPGSSANVIVDVFGWFSTSSYAPAVADPGARLIPTTPSRVLDTRPGAFNVGRPSGTPLAAHETMTLQIRGVNGINPPVTAVVPDRLTVTGVLLNVVGITGNTATHLSVFPNDLGGAAPTTSNLNLAPNAIKANLVFVPVGTDGMVRIFNNAGLTDVVADVVGYMDSGVDPVAHPRQGRVVPLSSPYRTFDTRDPQFGGVALGPGQAEDWSFAAFAISVAIGPDSVGNQLAVIGNLTSASLTRQYASAFVRSFLTAYPAKATRPLSSNLNSVEGPTPIPNMAILKYGPDATVSMYNLAGYEHYLFDASAVVLAD
jgi:hypothetical protein